mmetsp:Transcript_5862/g.14259  ORF Transcript_5862/g.14259 Transcript_5862/m.14259 type:complete len:179 (-) Transcript_5862:25-561(-)
MGGGSSAPKEIRAVFIGMPGAGAKALAGRAATGEFPATEAESSASLEWQQVRRTFEELDLHLLGLGSQTGLWREHLPSCQVLVFVVDGSKDIDATKVSSTFQAAFKDHGLPEGTPVVVLLNKMDLVEASIGEERKAIMAASMAAAGAMTQCKICSVSAKTGDDVDEAVRVICGNTLTF